MIAPEQEAHLRQLVRVFLTENQKLNLSAFRTEEACWVGNVLDSLALIEVLPRLQLSASSQILDVGTGGGFPLLPLAICLPQHRFVGIEARKKKVDAVQRIVDALALQNVELVVGRAEELGHDREHREKFDLVLARALSELPILLEECAPFARVKGYMISWKSLTIDRELRDSLLTRAELSCHLMLQHPYELPGRFGRRQLLVFEKTAPTPEKYPRAVGVPAKRPLR